MCARASMAAHGLPPATADAIATTGGRMDIASPSPPAGRLLAALCMQTRDKRSLLIIECHLA